MANFEYPKIETPFVRDMTGSKKLVEGVYRDKTIASLADLHWIFTEKVDGTNVRIYWDGHKVSFAGRTDKAQMPVDLINKLNELFGGGTNEEMFEQIFGGNEAVLFGEGYGSGIQAVGKDYIADGKNFILFDVFSRGAWFDRQSLEYIAQALHIDIVPILLEGTIDEAVKYVKEKHQSTLGSCTMEGLVGVPAVGLLDMFGRRVITKIKVKDFA